MRASLTAIAIILTGCVATAQQPDQVDFAKSWLNGSREWRESFILGYMVGHENALRHSAVRIWDEQGMPRKVDRETADALTAAVNREILGASEARHDLLLRLSQFYRDENNSHIPVLDAMKVVVDQAKGRDTAAMIAELQRKWSTH